MTIALDYDNCFTLDPDFWRFMVRYAENLGHRFVMVTGREESTAMGRECLAAIDGLMPVVFAGPEWKRTAAEKKGWKVDVWIDDHPEYVAKQFLLGRA
jgi:hypothetical protein